MGRICTIKPVNNQVEKIKGGGEELICLPDPLYKPQIAHDVTIAALIGVRMICFEDLCSQLVLTYGNGAEWLPEGRLVVECPVPTECKQSTSFAVTGAPCLETGRGAKA